jgi:hypothetical protein
MSASPYILPVSHDGNSWRSSLVKPMPLDLVRAAQTRQQASLVQALAMAFPSASPLARHRRSVGDDVSHRHRCYQRIYDMVGYQ